jgi:NAD(P)-dependent dehydrogenase (short-subunit alcohol dehydrogenase family)
MLPAGRGKIVNVASTAGKWASNNQSIYNMSKHALVGMTRCLALEMAPRGIQVNAICPYVVETDLVLDMAKGLGLKMEQLRPAILQRVPMGRLVTPEEVAHLAVYLASSESDGMTGQSILLDGGVLFI